MKLFFLFSKYALLHSWYFKTRHFFLPFLSWRLFYSFIISYNLFPSYFQLLLFIVVPFFIIRLEALFTVLLISVSSTLSTLSILFYKRIFITLFFVVNLSCREFILFFCIHFKYGRVFLPILSNTVVYSLSPSRLLSIVLSCLIF